MYDSQLGRFTSEDPIGFAGGDVNLFGYVSNSPTSKRDPLGLYPSFWRWNYHKTITERALAGRADPADIRILADQQYPHDTATQDPAYAPWHAMARPGQDPEDARREANQFVRNRICLAKRLSFQGFQADAMAYLAQAMYAMQYAASPAHHPFKPAWPNDFGSNLWEWRPWGHYHTENFDPGSGSAADENTRSVYDYYKNARPMPNDFFNNSYDVEPGIVRYSPYRH